jgi:hypothetical protein
MKFIDILREAMHREGVELGPVAKPFVPQIQALLNCDDVSIRQLAGKALRKIDPSALPPMNEGYT